MQVPRSDGLVQSCTIQVAIIWRQNQDLKTTPPHSSYGTFLQGNYIIWCPSTQRCQPSRNFRDPHGICWVWPMNSPLAGDTQYLTCLRANGNLFKYNPQNLFKYNRPLCTIQHKISVLAMLIDFFSPGWQHCHWIVMASTLFIHYS